MIADSAARRAETGTVTVSPGRALVTAPATFGRFAGDLIASDENTGQIWAVAPNGSRALVARSGLPHGGDTGVEGVAFVPPGFAAGGALYYADRATPDNPHAGTDSVLRLRAGELVGQGVREGDLLAATEGGAGMVAVRCAPACRVRPVVATPTSAHGEGHIVAVASRRAAAAGVPAAAIAAAGAAAALLAIGAVAWRRRSARR